MPTNLQQLYRHGRWANLRIMDACASLTPAQLAATCEGTYGPLWPTLAHLAAAESGYVHRLSGEPRIIAWRDPEPPPSLSTLTDALERSGARLIDLAATTADDHVASFTTTDGEEVHLSGWILLAQAIDHAREHRSHVATILTQLGLAPPEIDVWAYAESGAADEDSAETDAG
jgi:uncharacterized damage-inducible protein DinB